MMEPDLSHAIPPPPPPSDPPPPLEALVVPVIDLSDHTQVKTLLPHALFEWGNFVIINHGIEVRDIKRLAAQLFELPGDVKRAMGVEENPHFFGYTAIGQATTEGTPDSREDFDFGNDLPCNWDAAQPPHLRYRPGPNQWPPDHLIPGFKSACKSYSDAMMKLGMRFMRWIADVLQGREIALEDNIGNTSDPLEILSDPLDSSLFERYFDHSAKSGGRIKFVRYPPADAEELHGVGSRQGVGPHRDLWLTFLLHANDQPGLEVQSRYGTWLQVPPIPDSFVVTVGQALESVTHGVLLATHHRAVTPLAGAPERLTIPYFMDLSGDVTLGMIKGGLKVGEEINQQLYEWARWRRWTDGQRRRAILAATAPPVESRDTESAKSTLAKEPAWLPLLSTTLRELHFRGMVSRRPHVGRKWYPEIANERNADEE
ncbi:Clavaminate synthase-like protein [Gonapodya prolifera JEL478]|uniref:Clavaminate synthase-like protein n=1 Tax=Gonapodya prolifera (strain JEL478) TaxID=1344416 RepID=A0A139AJ32_GONPJ|nr:Clavaminate synthase-like protein [Gonapodya prolifera JEL478]|eukprot:KXS16800.1 Clavaminate synthase-like protein [Gonapodya prolifera JEL478]